MHTVVGWLVYAWLEIPGSDGTCRHSTTDHWPCSHGAGAPVLALPLGLHEEKCSTSGRWVRRNHHTRGDDWMWRRTGKRLAAVSGPYP